MSCRDAPDSSGALDGVHGPLRALLHATGQLRIILLPAPRVFGGLQRSPLACRVVVVLPRGGPGAVVLGPWLAGSQAGAPLVRARRVALA